MSFTADMDTADRDYFLHQAEAERALAQQARHEGAVAAHRTLASLYLRAGMCGAPAIPDRETFQC